MSANSRCICKLLLCRFQNTVIIRKFLFRNLSYYRVACNIYQFKRTIMQIENQLINDRSHNFVVIHT